jgi:hypothetical protein
VNALADRNVMPTPQASGFWDRPCGSPPRARGGMASERHDPEIELFRSHLRRLLTEIRQSLMAGGGADLPGIVERIFTLTADAESNVANFADVIAQTRRSPRASSRPQLAYYAPRQEVRTIAGAVMMLGFDEVKALCVAMKLVRAFPKFGENSSSMDDFWRHPPPPLWRRS